MIVQRIRVLSTGVLLILAVSQASLRPVTAQSPIDVVRTRNQAVERILDEAGDDVGQSDLERLKDVINSFIDFEELSRRGLGRYWDERTEQEQADFVNVFRELIRNSSVQKLSVHTADSVQYLHESINGTDATVNTVAYKHPNEIEIVYRMHKVGDEWMVFDMIVDGASTVRNYRDSFHREIAATSYSEMYAKLVRRLNENP